MPWEPMDVEIQGDHLAPVVWRDRLYLFWVTFTDKPLRASRFGATGSQNLASARLKDVADDVGEAARSKQIEAQLHSSEYLDGKWSASEVSDLFPITTTVFIPGHWERARAGETTASNGYVWVGATEPAVPLLVPTDFDAGAIFVHVSREPYENGEERGIHIHLTGAGANQSFYMPGRNAAPERRLGSPRPANPLSSADVPAATRYRGNGALAVEFRSRIVTPDGRAPIARVEVAEILRLCGAYTLLPCDSAQPVPAAPADASPDAAPDDSFAEIAALMQPVFMQDSSNTFFVEPTVTERTIEEWQQWVIPPPRTEPRWSDSHWWGQLAVAPSLPHRALSRDGDVSDRIDADRASLIAVKPRSDWLTNPGTVLAFDDSVIAAAGRSELKIVPASEAPDGRVPVNVHSAGGLPPGSRLMIAADDADLEGDGLARAPGGLNVVGSEGLNAGLAENFNRARMGIDRGDGR